MTETTASPVVGHICVPTEVAGALAALASQLRVPEYAVHVAAHLKVMSALTGEHRVAAALTVNGDHRVVDLALPGGSWADLVRAASDAEVAPVAGRRWPGETIVAIGSRPDRMPAETVLQVWCTPERIWLRGRPPRCDGDYLHRFGQYHVAALRAMAASVTSSHDVSLVGPAEADLQVHQHDAGRRALPDRRPHQLIEEQTLRDPAAAAIGYRGATWTYGELNRRANRIARLLLEQGLPREGAVAVITERTPDWAAAILGVFKAGGIYLPVDPTYPAERIAVMLGQSGAWAVVSPPAADSEPLRDALARVAAAGHATPRLVPIAGDPDGADHDGNPTVTVDADQAAYIYFTSGSTGRPKGALLEHAGMLNHLLAKIATLELRPDSVVVQNAPVCFDISLWQVMAPLMAGGRVEIIPQPDVVEVGRFIESLERSRATVLQVVPPYLELMLTELARRDRPVPHLRYVSVTGEALSRQLLERWLARFPGIPLVNAYGATEASDDTTHAVLTRAPDATSPVSLGSPIHNVAIYVVDERMRLVPLGAPGEIVFSGVCVGRGYINDEERTAEAFREDPFRPGQRLYRTGDYGRWLPHGELEFLGRRDDQVKIRGFRVELGEVEQRVLAVDGVHAATVLVHHRGAAGQRLVTFYVGEPDLSPARLTAALRAALPTHAMPAECHKLPALPVTENGKTDKRQLALLAERSGPAAGPMSRPRTPAERAVAAVWSEVLNRPLDEISRDDDFFASGGDSLAAARLVVRLERAVSLDDLISRPVLWQLAERLPPAAGGPRPTTSAVPAFGDSATDSVAD
jgi:amino acid adenylation domain-containing protein